MLDRLLNIAGRTLPSGGVTEQAIKSGMWVMSMNVFDRALQLLLMIILANILDPNDFGLFGIALLGLSTLRRFSKLGLNEALIYETEENVDEYLNTAMTLRILRGLFIAVVLFVSAPFIARLINEPRSLDIIRVVGISPLLLGFHNPGVVYFQKNLDFHKDFLYKISGSLSRFAVGIGLAFLFQNVWALVLSFLAADLGGLVASYFAHGYRPFPSLNLSRAREMIGYGKWITGGSIVYFLYSEGDDMVVTYLLNSTALGYYQFAYRLSNMPGTEVSEVIRSVSFPAFSKLQDDRSALRDAFYRTLRLTTFVSFPLAVGIAAVSPVFVRAFLGPEWVPMVLTMQILAGYGFLLSVTATYGSVWKAIGRPDYGTKLGAIRVILMAIFIVPVTIRFGIEGTAALVVGLFFFPMFPLDTYLLIESLDTNWRRIARELSYPAAASFLMGGTVVYLDRMMELAFLPLEFAVLVTVGVAVYALVALVFELQFDWGLEQQVRTISDALLG